MVRKQRGSGRARGESIERGSAARDRGLRCRDGHYVAPSTAPKPDRQSAISHLLTSRDERYLGRASPDIIRRRIERFVKSLERVQLFEYFRGKALPSASPVGEQIVEVALRGIAIVPSRSEAVGDPRKTRAEHFRLDIERQVHIPPGGGRE